MFVSGYLTLVFYFLKLFKLWCDRIISVGDRILAQWGKVIRAALRSNEVSGYWGNGDLIIGIPDRNKTQAKEHLAEVLTILRKQIFTSLDGDRFQVACNCSVAEFPRDGKTLHSLYQFCCQS